MQLGDFSQKCAKNDQSAGSPWFILQRARHHLRVFLANHVNHGYSYFREASNLRFRKQGKVNIDRTIRAGAYKQESLFSKGHGLRDHYV